MLKSLRKLVACVLLAGLAGLSLVLVEGYSSSKEVMKLYPDLRPSYVAKPLDGLSAVASGVADAYVGMLGVNGYLAAQNGITNLKVNAGFDMAVNGQQSGTTTAPPKARGHDNSDGHAH